MGLKSTFSEAGSGGDSTSRQTRTAKGRRVVNAAGYRVELDLSNQVLGIDIPEDWKTGPVGRAESPVAATVRGISEPGFASAAVLAQKAKQVDDRIYASVELALQRGAGRFAGKSHLLTSMLQSEKVPVPVLYTAAQLAGLDVSVPDSLGESVNRIRRGFLGNALRSKPIGFYTWNDQLVRIFQQDRMLQTPIKDMTDVEVLARAVHGNPTWRGVYTSYLDFISKLTNPPADDHCDLRAGIAQLDDGPFTPKHTEYFFISPSRAHETTLVLKLYGDKPAPDDFSLADEMVRRLQSGALSVEPEPDSGWYDFQTWSLEPLVRPERTPEAPRLMLTHSYRQQLVDLFKGILALTRETHIKQLVIPGAMSALCGDPDDPVIHIFPELSTEPVYSYYLRRALGYRFLWNCLEAHFGPDALPEIRTVSLDGNDRQTLAELVLETCGLFFGAATVLARQLGGLDAEADARKLVSGLKLDPETFATLGSGRGQDSDAEFFLRWTASRDDPDVFRDSRMMVPIFYDFHRGQTKVWAFLGWSSRTAEIHFERRPRAAIFDAAGKRADIDVQLQFGSKYCTLPYPVMAEIYVNRILDRDEFRAHCDRYRTQSAILENL